MIFDSRYEQDLKDTIQYGGGLFWDSTVREYGTPFDTAAIKWAVDNCVEEGKVGWKADTIEELARKLGIDENELARTVGRYNELCLDGRDLDFGKRPELMTPVARPPFYALKISGALLHIPAGLSVNTDMQVLDTERKPIEGL